MPTSQVLQYLGFEPEIDFSVRVNTTGELIVWFSGTAQPSPAVMAATEADPAYLAWFDENGNDPILTRRKNARDAVGDAGALNQGQRAELGERNKRDNYLVSRILELQAAMDAMKASAGAAQNIRDAIPASWSATSTRDRPTARQDLLDEIDSGDSDT